MECTASDRSNCTMSLRSQWTTWLLIVSLYLLSVSISNQQCVSDCEDKTGYFPDCKRCDYFTQCDHGLLHRMPCQAKTFFNPYVNVCTEALPSYCDSNGNYTGAVGQLTGQGSQPIPYPSQDQQSSYPDTNKQNSSNSGESQNSPVIDNVDDLFGPQPASSNSVPKSKDNFDDLFQNNNINGQLDDLFNFGQGSFGVPAAQENPFDDLFRDGNTNPVPNQNGLKAMDSPPSQSQYNSFDDIFQYIGSSSIGSGSSSVVGSSGTAELKSYPYCTVNCAGIPDGIFADCQDCHKYVTCQRGNWNISTCRDGYYYNYTTGYCVEDTHNICVTPVKSEETPPTQNQNQNQLSINPPSEYVDIPWPPGADTTSCVQSCLNSKGRPIPSGIYRHCRYCNDFVMCSNGYLTVHSCPEKTFFNPTISVCDHDKGQCSREYSTEVSPPLNNQNYEAVFPVSTAQNQNKCLVTCRTVQGKQADGRYVFCTSCNTYIECNNGQSTVTTCLQGYFYHEKKGRCVYDFQKICNQSLENSNAPFRQYNGDDDQLKVFNSCLDSCDGQNTHIMVGRYGHCTYCNVYLECKQNEGEQMIFCPDGQQYNQTSGHCETDSLGECVPNSPAFPVFGFCITSCQGALDGRYGHCEYYNIYIDCVGQNEHRVFCQDGQQFDMALGNCVPYENQESALDSLKDEDMIGPNYNEPCGSTDNCDDYDCINSCFSPEGLVTDGQYASCTYCSVYLTCKEGTMAASFCEENQVYDKKSGKCVEDKSNICTNKRIATLPTLPQLITDCMGPNGPLPDGFYGHSENCNVIVACLQGLMLFDFCKPGSVYDKSVGKCVLRSTSNCQNSSQYTTDVESYSNIDKYLVRNTDDPVIIACIESCTFQPNPGQSMQVPNGYYSYCPDEKAYVVCKNGLHNIYSCPPGYIYQAEDGSCIRKLLSQPAVPGISVLKTGETLYNTCVRTCFLQDRQTVPDGLYSYCGDCNQYVHCQGQTQQTDSCPSGTFYNSVSGTCDTDTAGSCYQSTSQYSSLENFLNRPLQRDEIVTKIQMIKQGKYIWGESQEMDFLTALLTKITDRLNDDDRFPAEVLKDDNQPNHREYVRYPNYSNLIPQYQEKYLQPPPQGYAPPAENYLLPSPDYQYQQPQYLPPTNGFVPPQFQNQYIPR